MKWIVCVQRAFSKLDSICQSFELVERVQLFNIELKMVERLSDILVLDWLTSTIRCECSMADGVTAVIDIQYKLFNTANYR